VTHTKRDKRPANPGGLYRREPEPETVDDLLVLLRTQPKRRDVLQDNLALCDRYVLHAPDAYRAHAAELAGHLLTFRKFLPRLLAPVSPADAKLASMLLLKAMSIGACAEQLRANMTLETTARAGAGTRRGGRKSANEKHGTEAEREAKRKAWRQRFAQLRSDFPEAKRGVLGAKLANETGVSWRTLRRYIKQK
jgi:hypothetical protein